jgi:uncharacterized protein (UPF0335 family)
VDLPQDGSDSTFDGRDGKVDGIDDNSVVNASQRIPAAEATAAASPQQPPDMISRIRAWRKALANDTVGAYIHGEPIDSGPETTLQFSAATLVAITDHHYESQNRLNSSKATLYKNFRSVYGKLDSLLEKVDTVIRENTVLRKAHEASRRETAALQAAVDTLTRKLDEHTTISAPPSLEIRASSTAIEEMTMQLSVVQHDIQDVLEAVCNPPGKRKRHTSNQDTEPTTPTNR